MVSKEYIEQSLKFGKLEVSKLNQDVMDIGGLTSKKIKCFLNNLCGYEGSKYLEIGVHKGATFFSALYNNKTQSIAIDNWSVGEIIPSIMPVWANNQKQTDIKAEFLGNLKKFRGTNDVQILHENYLNFDKKKLLYEPNIVFYDGEHTFADQYQVLLDLQNYSCKDFVLIVDDWNWEKRGILKGIEDSCFKIEYKKEIFTKIEDPEDFWNGLGIFKLKK